MSAPMAGVSGGLLAAEVAKAGGMGTIAAGHFQDVIALEKEIVIFQEETKAIASKDHAGLTIGFIGFSSLATPTGWQNYEHILQHYKPKAVQFFAPSVIVSKESGRSNIKLAHEYGAKFLAQVGSISEAKEAIQHKVDAIICQGSEAGGHGLRRQLGNSATALASQTAKMTDIPVLMAGGIVNGAHVASALCVCDGVSVGTRFWAANESLGDKRLQTELTKSNSCDDCIRTTVFDQIQNATSSTKWPHPYDSTGALRNRTTNQWEGKTEEELQFAIDNTTLLEQYRASREESDAEVIPTLAGEGVGEIASIDGAYALTLRLEKEAIDAIDALKSKVSSH